MTLDEGVTAEERIAHNLDKYSVAAWSAWFEKMYALGFDFRWVPLTKKFYPEYVKKEKT
jgi:mannose/fructose/N-acetylgalactosamine-specific phosphotransferase system component IID